MHKWDSEGKWLSSLSTEGETKINAVGQTDRQNTNRIAAKLKKGFRLQLV